MTEVASETLDHTYTQYEGESVARNITFRTRIKEGQTIIDVDWLTKAPVALEALSGAIDGDTISGTFDTTGCVEGESYGVVGIATLANPTETFIDYFYLQIIPLPADVT